MSLEAESAVLAERPEEVVVAVEAQMAGEAAPSSGSQRHEEKLHCSRSHSPVLLLSYESHHSACCFNVTVASVVSLIDTACAVPAAFGQCWPNPCIIEPPAPTHQQKTNRGPVMQSACVLCPWRVVFSLEVCSKPFGKFWWG